MDQTKGMLEEDKLFLAKLNSLVQTCELKQTTLFTYFLNEKEIYFANRILAKMKDIGFCFFGGYLHSERKILCVYPKTKTCLESNFPISIFQLSYSKNFKLSHRDFLGTLMSLKLDRSLIGDILPNDEMGQAYLFAHNNCEQIILSELEKVKNVGIKVERITKPNIEKRNELAEETIVVSSLRLDAVVGAIVKTSREKASQLIRQGLVFVNYAEEKKVSKLLQSEDKLTIRGKGKFIVKEVSHISKKGKLHLCYQKYQ